LAIFQPGQKNIIGRSASSQNKIESRPMFSLFVCIRVNACLKVFASALRHFKANAIVHRIEFVVGRSEASWHIP
jgi:hypothetical protein